MNDITTLPAAHSRAAIAKAGGLALLVALILLATVILPAEYGLDPLGTGRVLGLNALYSAGEQASGTPRPAVLPAEGLPPFHAQPLTFNEQTIALELEPGQWIEHKYKLQEGATMIFTWTASGEVMADLHTEPEGKPADASESFAMETGSTGSGSYTAPYNGLHGWFFQNESETDAVTITLEVSGFFREYRQYYDDTTHKDFTIP